MNFSLMVPRADVNEELTRLEMFLQTRSASLMTGIPDYMTQIYSAFSEYLYYVHSLTITHIDVGSILEEHRLVGTSASPDMYNQAVEFARQQFIKAAALLHDPIQTIIDRIDLNCYEVDRIFIYLPPNRRFLGIGVESAPIDEVMFDGGLMRTLHPTVDEQVL